MSRAFRLGVFILGTLAILGAAVFLIGSNRFLFSSKYRLKANFETVSGLDNGADVRVGGIHEGTVSKILLPTHPGDKVTVLMDLKDSTRKVIKKDSVAAIQTEGLIGNKFVTITFGSPDAPPVRDGDSIEGAPPVDISDLISKANDILTNTQTATKNFNQITENMTDVASKINSGKGTIGALVNDKTLYDQAKAGITSLNDNMEALKGNFFLRGFFKKRGYKDAAELTQYEIKSLPQSPPVKTFSYDTTRIFSKPDTAKLKDQKALDEAGQFLQSNKFGTAVVVDYSSLTGDSAKEKQLSEARAMVVRDYLVQKFKFDDTRLKTLGLGKQGALQTGQADKLEVEVYSPEVKAPPPTRASTK